ncbi:dihydrofolate reductase family protein [Candidatus Poriferisocius sp.]|uniref:dihydrofolate reductase family protein n=1 Tax=Candidatus Poriferisocius sp. TaxID=3101276 RepID=UPI003B5CFC89
MDQLLPEFVGDVDPIALYGADRRVPPEDRPWLMLNMVTSVDGATSADQVSGTLSSPGDRRVFAAIRAVADVILVGAETVRREGYGPPRAHPAAAAARAGRKQAPRPRLAVVSGSLDLDFAAPLFDDDPPPLLFTGAEPPADRLARAEATADVHRLGNERVEPAHTYRPGTPRVERADSHRPGTPRVEAAAVVARLGQLGAQVVLAEGGPRLNSQLVAEGLVDELCWTISPLLAGGDSARLVEGGPPGLAHLRLARVLVHDHSLFLRYLTH